MREQDLIDYWAIHGEMPEWWYEQQEERRQNMQHTTGWNFGTPPDEFEKVVLWSPKAERPEDRPKYPLSGICRFGRYIHNVGWQLRGMGDIVTPDHHIDCWLDIPALPEL